MEYVFLRWNFIATVHNCIIHSATFDNLATTRCACIHSCILYILSFTIRYFKSDLSLLLSMFFFLPFEFLTPYKRTHLHSCTIKKTSREFYPNPRKIHICRKMERDHCYSICFMSRIYHKINRAINHTKKYSFNLYCPQDITRIVITSDTKQRISTIFNWVRL